MQTSQMIQLIDRMNLKNSLSNLENKIEFFIENNNEMKQVSLASFNPYYGQIRLVDERSNDSSYGFRRALKKLKQNESLRFKYGFDNYKLIRCIIRHSGLNKIFRIELAKA